MHHAHRLLDLVASDARRRGVAAMIVRTSDAGEDLAFAIDRLLPGLDAAARELLVEDGVAVLEFADDAALARLEERFGAPHRFSSSDSIQYRVDAVPLDGRVRTSRTAGW